MKSLKISSRIILGFLAIIAITGGLGTAVYLRLSAIKDQTASLVKDSLPGLYDIERIDDLVRAVYALILKHTLIRDRADGDRLIAEIQTALEQINKTTEHYEARKRTAQDAHLIAALKDARGPYARAFIHIVKLNQEQKFPEAAQLIAQEMTPAYQRFLETTRALVAYNQSQSNEACDRIDRLASLLKSNALNCLWAELLVALVICVFVVRAIKQPLGRLIEGMKRMSGGDLTTQVQLVRQDEFGTLAGGLDQTARELAILVHQVQTSGLQVDSAVTHIAAASRQQQATAAEIASSTIEIGATSKEISATSKELLKAIEQVSRVATHTRQLADSGQAGLGRLGNTILQIMEASGGIAERLTVMNEKAANINKVVTTISKLAGQTNLLSLNAAIEAEKAGEFGLGFAVVATEIRRLADQTAVATHDIGQMVGEIQAAVGSGVAGLDKFTEAVQQGVVDAQQVSGQLNEIIEQVQTLTPQFATVNEGMQSQSQGAEQISEALLELSESAQQTAASLHESHAVVATLSGAARQLRTGVERFKVAA